MLTTPPTFITSDPAAIAQAITDDYQAAAGKTLYPAQVESLWVQIMAYRESVARADMQNAALECLVNFADDTHLEGLGTMVGVTGRLPASPAVVDWQLALPEAQDTDAVFPAGWAATGPDGTAFALISTVTIAKHTLTATGTAQAAVAGPGENGIPAGTTFTPLAGTATVTSTNASDGGSDQETDDQLRERIRQAPFGFSVAGPSGAYRFFARGASPSIVDVAVTNGGNGVVNVYPLCNNGLPGADVLAAVSAALDDDSVRPLNDQVNVTAPQTVNYTITANVTLYRTADPASVIPAVTAAANAYVAAKAAKLGQPLVGSQIIAALSLPGVFSVQLAGWTDQNLAPNQWADGSVVINNAGFASV